MTYGERMTRGGRASVPSEDEVLELAEAPTSALLERAAAVRDAHWGKTLSYSPKVFLPITNLCRNRCDYCSFRRSPGDPGEWTMSPDEITALLRQARGQGCVEALLCLGDKPESGFASYRSTLAGFGQQSTVDYLVWASRRALELGLLPHTNAGVLSADDMRRLRALNVSLGLMLESASERLCDKGMPHHRAPDKRPARRLQMLHEAGELGIAMTTGILIGIGETPRERAEALLAIRRLHREHGHIQEVIVQNFTPHPGTPLAKGSEPGEDAMLHAVALARLTLDAEISVQAPPNLNPGRTLGLIRAGINDFGGISPVTEDFINPGRPWPEVARLREACARAGFGLEPRLPVYPAFVERGGFVDPALLPQLRAAARRIHPSASNQQVAVS